MFYFDYQSHFDFKFSSLINIELCDFKLAALHNENFFYKLTIFDESFFENSKSINVDNWRLWLKKHENRNFANALIDIFIFDIKIEYIESKQLILINNHFFVFNAFDIFIKNFQKQMKIHCITRVNDTFHEIFISFSLNFVSKTNDDWKRIHDLSYLKRKFISVNVFIFEKRDILKYIIFDEIVVVLIFMNKNVKLIKRNLIDAFKHVSIVKFDWWLLSFFLTKHLLFWSFFIIWFQNFILHIRFFNQKFQLNFYCRFELSHCFSLFKRFFRHFTFWDRWNWISTSIRRVVRFVKSQNES